MSRATGISEEHASATRTWRESEVFSPVERLALEYAEALTRTPAAHRPDLLEGLRAHLSEKQVVELTAVIAWEGFRARFNRGFDVQPEGYSGRGYCVLPDSHTPSP